MGGMSISEELRDDGGFRDDGAIVVERGDEAARVDLEVFSSAGHAEVYDLLLEREAQLGEGDVSSVCPGTAVVGIEGDFGAFFGTHLR